MLSHTLSGQADNLWTFDLEAQDCHAWSTTASLVKPHGEKWFWHHMGTEKYQLSVSSWSYRNFSFCHNLFATLSQTVWMPSNETSKSKNSWKIICNCCCFKLLSFGAMGNQKYPPVGILSLLSSPTTYSYWISLIQWNLRAGRRMYNIMTEKSFYKKFSWKHQTYDTLYLKDNITILLYI